MDQDQQYDQRVTLQTIRYNNHQMSQRLQLFDMITTWLKRNNLQVSKIYDIVMTLSNSHNLLENHLK